MIKHLLIDLDDTLWDTQHNNQEALYELFDKYGWARAYPSFEEFYTQFAPHNDHCWALYREGKISKHELIVGRFSPFLAPVGIDTEEGILRFNQEFLATTSQKSKLVEGARELLEALAPYYRLAVISNGFREVQMRKMKSSGIDHYFDKVVLSEDAGINKPHKRIFDFALSSANMDRTTTLVIGDSLEADILGAQNARLPSIWFNPQQKPLPERDFTAPIYIVSNLAEIPSLLSSLRLLAFRQ